MSKNPGVAVFDIGGTEIKYGVMYDYDCFACRKVMKTDADKEGSMILRQVIDAVLELKKTYVLSAVSLSSPGVIDSTSGVCLSASDTIRNYQGLHIVKIVKNGTGLPVYVENDVNCAALAESFHVDSFLMMTIGTGIGGAIVHEGKLIKGHTFSAGEWGHMVIGPGRFEDRASMSFVVEEARRRGLTIDDGLGVFELFDAGEPIARDVISHFYEHLAEGIANIVYAFNPKTIILGGGVSNRDDLVSGISSKLKNILSPFYRKSFVLRRAIHRNDAGMIGAYMLVKTKALDIA
jgi:predicted NBD/HSP70 family sugar kinase